MSWEAIPGAEKYQVILFNGAYHSYWDVPATETSWTTKGKGMFPTPEQLQTGTIDYLRNGSGMELLAQPSPLYEQAYEQKGGTDYSFTDNYYVRLTAVHADGARPISPAVTARIPLMEPDEEEVIVTVEEMQQAIEQEGAMASDIETAEAYDAGASLLDPLTNQGVLSDEQFLELNETLAEGVLYEDEEEIAVEPFGTLNPHVGRILYIPSARTMGVVAHGHVEVGSDEYLRFVEATKGTGVKSHYNRYKTYVDSFKGRKLQGSNFVLNVHGSTTTQKRKAGSYAENQVNKPYSIAPGFGTSSFYCSELVYRAWRAGGRDVGSINNRYWTGGYVLPYHIFIDLDTRIIGRF
ncbi:hypothetical protein [Exiguobacterium sp. 8H]|uniref:hypothetical protein n=1 Tax=Exiguobacterium sp. 8H TaxID=2653140 RepID=UPI00135745A1|nr:hypothetical protein [Exiguobacterium sp. 8H]